MGLGHGGRDKSLDTRDVSERSIGSTATGAEGAVEAGPDRVFILSGLRSGLSKRRKHQAPVSLLHGTAAYISIVGDRTIRQRGLQNLLQYLCARQV